MYTIHVRYTHIGRTSRGVHYFRAPAETWILSQYIKQIRDNPADKITLDYRRQENAFRKMRSVIKFIGRAYDERTERQMLRGVKVAIPVKKKK